MNLENFYPLLGYEDRYLISRTGEVYSNHFGRTIRQYFDKNNYIRVHLFNGERKVIIALHRLIALQFVEGRTEVKWQVNHINGNKLDNNPDNLEWVSGKENIQHAWRTGLKTARKGIRHHNARLCDSDIKEIRRMLDEGIPQGEIAKKYNIAKTAISKINVGIRWGHVQ